LFIIQFFYFCRAGVSLTRVLCLYIRGIAVGIPHAAYLLICWYASLKQGWSWRLVAPPVSPCNVEWRSLVWAGGASGVRVLLLLGVSFLPSVAPPSQQDF
jgi:hypothetical protein